MSDKMREEFEKEYGADYLQKESDGSYSGFHAKIAWEYWQKSRAALVIELPNCNNESHDEYREYLEIELENAGVRYE